jgi:hypothetical protein
MYENYMLLTRGFKNIHQDGQIIGFQLLAKIAYYRGITLPLIGGFEVKVDGEKFGSEQMRFTIGHNTYTFAETADADDVQWEFGKPLTITVLKAGGLKPGVHEVEFLQNIKPDYFTESGRPSTVIKKMTLVV